MRSLFSSPRFQNVTSFLLDQLDLEASIEGYQKIITYNFFLTVQIAHFFKKNQISILTCVHCFLVPLEPLSPRIRNVTSRWIDLTWQPPSNAAKN